MRAGQARRVHGLATNSLTASPDKGSCGRAAPVPARGSPAKSRHAFQTAVLCHHRLPRLGGRGGARALGARQARRQAPCAMRRRTTRASATSTSIRSPPDIRSNSRYRWYLSCAARRARALSQGGRARRRAGRQPQQAASAVA